MVMLEVLVILIVALGFLLFSIHRARKKFYNGELGRKYKKEEFRCQECRRRIPPQEYVEFNGLCRWCRGASAQAGGAPRKRSPFH